MHQNQFSSSAPSFKASRSPQSIVNSPNLLVSIKLIMLSAATLKIRTRLRRNEHQQLPYVWLRFPSLPHCTPKGTPSTVCPMNRLRTI
jgi:hypothetical protein